MKAESFKYRKTTYEIRLGDMFWYILSGWRFLLGIMLSGGMVLGAYMYWYSASNGIGEGFGDYLSGGYIVIGSLLGFVLGFVIRAFRYLLSGKLQTPFAIGDRYTVRTFFFKDPDKQLNGADKLLFRCRYRSANIYEWEEFLKLLISEAEVLKKENNAGKLLITGTELGNRFIRGAAASLSVINYTVLERTEIADDSSLIKEIPNISGAIIFENLGTAEMWKIDRELDYLALRNVPVIAVAVSV